MPNVSPGERSKILDRLKTLLTVAMLGGLVYLIVTHLDAKLLLQLFRSLSPLEVVLIALFPVGFVLVRALRFTLLLSPPTRRGQLTAVYGYFASQAVSSFPTGIAGRAAVLRSSGLPLGHNVVPLMTDSFFDLAFFALSTLIIAAVDPTFRTPAYLLVPALICLAPLGLMGPLRHRVKRLTFAGALRFHQIGAWKNLLRSCYRLANPRLLAGCAALTVVANLISLAALRLAVHAFNLQVAWTTLLISVTVPTLLGRIIFLPGSGTGVVAAGMATILVHAGGFTANQGAAVSIVYRIIDMGLPSLYGGLLLLLVRSPGTKAQAASVAA